VPLAGLRGEPDALPPAVVSRVLRLMLLAAGCPAGSLAAGHVQAVTRIVEGGAPGARVALPGGRVARREGDRLVVRA
jgi:hypothetical protein